MKSIEQVKKRKEEIDRADKVPKRKHLFQPQCNPLFPEELVALTPETPAKTKDHPCYSQTEVKRPKAVMKAGSQSSRKHTIEQVCSHFVIEILEFPKDSFGDSWNQFLCNPHRIIIYLLFQNTSCNRVVIVMMFLSLPDEPSWQTNVRWRDMFPNEPWINRT